jgi:MFS superfamily sulfate permease-like transporter
MVFCCCRMLLTIKYYGKRYPRLKWLRPLGPISACLVAIIAVVAGNLQNKGIKIVGHIPAGTEPVSYNRPFCWNMRLDTCACC